MSRPIKFRAWDKKNKRLVNFGLFDLDGGIYLDDDNTFSVDECPIMQFTGVLDKNGKEIYEGDILAGLSGIGMRNGENQVVSFQDGVFGINGMGFNEGSSEYNWTTETIEVIGNIYETPELLK